MFDENITFYAFRYCLGRQTYAVQTCVEYMLLYWDAMSSKCQHNIIREIRAADQEDALGMDMDKEQWMRVIARSESAGLESPS